MRTSNARQTSSWIFQQQKKKTPKRMARAADQKFDSLFVLDFEATCDSPVQIAPHQEVIEFPCIRLAGPDLREAARFHRYVRPRANPVLTPFCTELTGITQDMVAGEDEFRGVLSDFLGWFDAQSVDSFTFVTCGDWDLKTMLPEQCRAAGLEVPACFAAWTNVKKSYHAATGTFPRSLAAMLAGLGLGFEGRPHSGIDDVANIARVVRELALRRGHVFEHTFKRKI